MIYFVKPIGMDGPIKIGVTTSLENRLVALDSWSPFPLEIIASADGDGVMERRFHALFAHLRMHGEWFRHAPELVDAIEAVNAGCFDFNSLPVPVPSHGRNKNPRPWHFKEQATYSSRVHHAEKRSGFRCPVNPAGMIKAQDHKRIAIVDAFLADPKSNGIAA